MIVEERKSNEINLEAIDSDLRMENVRQSAEKLGWDYFGRSVRRNLMEKRQTLDAGTRLDVLNSLAFMKEYLPIDKEASVAQKVQQLVEGLGENCGVTVSDGRFTIKNPDVTIDIGVAEENIISCKIGYFGQPLFEAPEALELMKNGEFGRLRDLIAGIISLLPKDITLSDKNACKEALRALEHVLIRDAADSSFTSICTSKYGFYSPRTELRPGRLYFIAEPFMVRLAEKEGKSHPDNSDLDLLPHIEFSFVKHDKPSKLPVFTQSGEWTTFNDANVCICVRFNHGFLCSQQTIRKLSNIVPKSPLVRNYVNFYRYMTGRSTIKSDLKLLTQFPDETDIQQQFNIDFKRFSNEDDVVAIEMFLSDLRDLPKLIETLRSEWMHASLWESILAICERKQGSEQREVKTVVIELVPRRNEFYLQFDTEYGSMTMQICENSSRKYTVKTTSQLTGDSPSKELDNMLSEKLNSSWNIPTTLTFAVADLKCRLKSILNCANTSFDFYKLQHSWLVSNSKTMQTQQETKVVANKKPVKVLEIGPAIVPTQLVYTREDDEEFRGSLLASFGEVDPYYVRTSTIGRTRAQPRPKREPNQLTSMDLMSTELERGRHSMEGSARPHDVHTSSFLESARVRMKQSIGAAHAVGLASHQLPASPAPGPVRQHPYGMGFDPPMPYDPSTHFPEPPAFGKKPRKSRAKKQPSEDGVASAGRGKGSRKGRGACAVGATGGRKSTGGAGENPFGMDQMRPPLQRSFSDYPGQLTSPQMSQYQQMQQMQQYQQSQNQQYRMQQMQHQQMQSPRNPLVPAYTDEDSDEEWDPPPPPKPQVSSAAAPRNPVPPPPPQQLGNPMVGYPGMPLQSPNHLPLTPSPLSAPPKPFSPEQNHFGMKMREVAYWKEIERIETKPDIDKLKRHLFADSSQAASSDSARSTAKVDQTESSPMTSTESSSTKSTAATPKKKMCLEAAISKIRGQQEQALQKQQQQQQHLQQQESVESNQSEQLTPQPMMEQQSTVPPLLAPHQLNRARNLNDIFDDEADDQSTSTTVTDVKPPIPEMQKTSIDSSSSSSGFPHPPALTPHLKKESADEAPEREKEKLIIKIPKIIKTSLEDRKDEKRDERREKDRERDRDRDRDGDRDRERNEKEKDDKAVRDKEKKERERERRRQRDRERAEQKRSERDKDGKDPSTSSSLKKRKLDKKDEKEKDRSEPDRKKGKSEGKDYNKTTTSMTPTSSLRNYRIPKKDTVEDDKKDVKDEALTAGPSSELKKEATAAPILRKESTISSAPPLQRKESFTSQSSSFAQPEHHREVPLKKKPPPPPSGPPPGPYPGLPNVGPIPSNIRGNNSSSGSSRKPPMPPPPPMMRGPPAEQMYRERAGSMRGFPPSSHYHSSVSGVNKQVASYAQGLPPGMGPPAIKPHGSNYQASQWVRPPTHRDSSHSYHGMPSLGPPQLQRELPPPPPQMIPLPKDPPVLREHPRERAHRGADDDGPDSPEEGTLRIDDE